MNLLELYDFAESENIPIFWFDLDTAESLSYQDEDSDRYIAMNPWYLHTVGEEKVKLAHELGHCVTGSFYNRWATCDVRQKHENRANKWAIEHLVPRDALEAAVADGCTEAWELAERFDVTEELMRKAVCWYKNGNLAVS